MANDTAYDLPLLGRRILITRPVGQADALASLVEAKGGTATTQSLFEIQPPENNSIPAALLAEASDWSWLIFISANAVRYACKIDPQLSQRLAGGACRIAAIGEATAQELRLQGFKVDLIPSNGSNSEALLAEALFQNVLGQKMLIVRGTGGREHLAETLRLRGAEIVYAEVYRRVAIPIEAFQNTLEEWQSGRMDCIVVTSGEALSRLTYIARAYGFLPHVLTTPMVVLGDRIASLAREEGWTNVGVSKVPGDDGLLQVIEAMCPKPIQEEPPESPAKTLDESSSIEGAFESDIIPEVGTVEITAPLEIQDDNLQDNEPMQPLGDENVNLDPTEVSPDVSHDPTVMPSEDDQTQDESMSVKDLNEVPKKRKRGFFGYFMLLLIAGIAGGGWYWLQSFRANLPSIPKLDRVETPIVQEERKPAISNPPPPNGSEMASIHAEIASLQTRLATDDAKIERLLSQQGGQFDERLEATRSEVLTEIQSIRHQLNNTRGDILIADAEYLLSIANQKLHLVGDVKSVLAAMQAADDRLRESGDPTVYKVRTVLAEEMAQLRNLSAPDFVGIASKLLYLEKLAEGLPLVLPSAETVKTHEKEKNAEKPAAQPQEGDAVDAALRELKGLVTVRHAEQSVEVILAPEQAAALRQVLVMRLETTRAALLRNDEKLFKDSLDAVKDWIARHFDRSSEQAKIALVEIDDLTSHSLGINYPDISQSMAMLQNIGKLRFEAEQSQLKPNKPSGSLESTPKVTEPEKTSVNKADGSAAPAANSGVDTSSNKQESKTLKEGKPSEAPTTAKPPEPKHETPQGAKEPSDGERL
jgi:uncharacterized protein HemX/uroporphyrinogen-III synthase